MKKILIILGVLVLIGVIALAVFLATFDVDRYRPMVVKQISTAIGRPVRLEHISLAWHDGVSLELKNLAVEPDSAGTEPPAQVENVHLVVRLLPLLKRNIQVASVSVVRPRLHVERGADGLIKVEGLYPLPSKPASAAQPAGATPSASTALPLLISMVQIEDGTIRVNDKSTQPPLDLTIQEINVDLRNISLLPPGSVQLKRFSAKLAGGTVTADGTIQNLFTKPEVAFQAQAQNLALENLVPASNPSEPTLRGNFSGSFQGKFQGTAWPEISNTLSGQGRVSLTNGAIVNMNILREIFQRISIIPGLAENLAANLPASYQEKFNAKDTLLQPIDFPMAVERGAVSFNNIRVATDTFELNGSGRLGLDCSLSMQSRVTVEPQLSAAMLQSVKELQILADSQGRVEIPVLLQGTLPKIRVMPDISSVASRLTTTKAEELIGGLLEKMIEKRKKKSSGD